MSKALIQRRVLRCTGYKNNRKNNRKYARNRVHTGCHVLRHVDHRCRHTQPWPMRGGGHRRGGRSTVSHGVVPPPRLITAKSDRFLDGCDKLQTRNSDFCTKGRRFRARRSVSHMKGWASTRGCVVKRVQSTAGKVRPTGGCPREGDIARRSPPQKAIEAKNHGTPLPASENK